MVVKRERNNPMTIKIFIRRLKKILSDDTFYDEIRASRRDRIEAEKKINGMIADLNGCSESWFLSPKQTLDECVPKDSESKNGL